MMRHLGLLLVVLGTGTMLSACDPFAAATTEIDQSIPDGEAGKIELLSSKQRLPQSAVNVRLHYLKFQDPVLHLRFEAPLGEALRFARDYAGFDLTPGCSGIEGAGVDLDWWLKKCPAGASGAQMVWADNPPARTVVVVPNGSRATVWIYSFTT